MSLLYLIIDLFIVIGLLCCISFFVLIIYVLIDYYYMLLFKAKRYTDSDIRKLDTLVEDPAETECATLKNVLYYGFEPVGFFKTLYMRVWHDPLRSVRDTEFNLIYRMPLKRMPLYINEAEHKTWKAIATWRLLIGK